MRNLEATLPTITQAEVERRQRDISEILESLRELAEKDPSFAKPPQCIRATHDAAWQGGSSGHLLLAESHFYPTAVFEVLYAETDWKEATKPMTDVLYVFERTADGDIVVFVSDKVARQPLEERVQELAAFERAWAEKNVDVVALRDRDLMALARGDFKEYAVAFAEAGLAKAIEDAFHTRAQALDASLVPATDDDLNALRELVYFAQNDDVHEGQEDCDWPQRQAEVKRTSTRSSVLGHKAWWLSGLRIDSWRQVPYNDVQ